MRLFFLTVLTMMAFAANSLLNRAGLAGDFMGPAGFAMLRVAAGAIVLWGLLWAEHRTAPRRSAPDIVAVLALVAYLVGFSFAYIELDAGLGALVLFAIVQVTMFAGGVIGGDRYPATRWGGMIVSLVGLAYLVWPTDGVDFTLRSLGLMAVAAVGWGVYSLAGRRADRALDATAWNFVYATPIVLVIALPFVFDEELSSIGIFLAVISGALTSGLGYALWYRVLPQLGASKGALVQLSVPVFAMLAGVLLLAESIDARAITASALVLGGIAIGLVARG